MLSFISKGTVLDAQAPQRQVCAVQQGHTVSALLGDLLGQALVLAVILNSFVFSAGFFKVGADFAVGVLDIPDGRFQLGGGFILQICGGSLSDFHIGLHGGKPLFFRAQLKFKVCNNLFLPLEQICELGQLAALALILSVPGQNVLLLADEVGRAHRFVRRFRVGNEFLGKVFFLLGQLTGEGSFVVQGLDLHVTGVQFSTDADDPQQDVRLFFVGGVHEAGQVEG